MKSIGVERPQDIAFAGKGRVIVISETQINGLDTQFVKELQEGDTIQISGLPDQIVEKIMSNTELTLKKPGIKSYEEEKQYAFKVFPKVDQSQVYESVWQHLSNGNCIGIFPEGGSHDRTDLLPLKAGVALMALGAM